MICIIYERSTFLFLSLSQNAYSPANSWHFMREIIIVALLTVPTLCAFRCNGYFYDTGTFFPCALSAGYDYKNI